MNKKPLVVLTGPTAVGKTKLSLALAKELNGEIVSADSAQVYRYMDIGSAKIKPEEMEGIRHHLIDVLHPCENFNVVIFQQMVEACLTDIYNRGKIPILTGGTGFYIQAILYGIDFTQNEDNPNIRAELEKLALEKGNEYIHGILAEVDPEAAEAIHPNNQKRVIRAIEFFRLTNTKISVHNERERQKESIYESRYFVLQDKRELLYERIDRRVEAMIQEGLINEVKELVALGCNAEMVSMQALGYKQILAYLKDEYSLEEAIYRIKRDTRHFAKRQLTWFQREKDVIWVPKWEFDYQEARMLSYMLEKSDR